MTLDEAVEPTSHHFTSEGLTLHYADWGNEAAPPLLLIHGTRDHGRSWDWTARRLADRWHVMALDLRGHGDSAWSPDGAYLLPYHLLDLIAFIETLGHRRLTIIAHSFGGAVASRYAGLYPDRVAQIVFVDSLGPAPNIYAKWQKDGPVLRTSQWIDQRRDQETATPRYFATIEQAAERMQRANPRLSSAQAYHLAKHGVRPHADGYGWKFDPRVSIFAAEDFEIRGGAFWACITAPALIMHGNHSWTTDPAQDGRAAFFPNQRTITFADAGHWIHHDQLDDFCAALDDFFSTPGSTRAVS